MEGTGTRSLSMQELVDFRSIVAMKLEKAFGVDYRKAMEYLRFIAFADDWTFYERCRRNVPYDDLAAQIEEFDEEEEMEVYA